MAVLFITMGVVIGLVVLVLAVIGGWGCLEALLGSPDNRTPLDRQAWQAEREIAEIGRRAQEAIMTEALNRLRSRHDRRW